MTDIHPQFITDAAGNRVSVVIPIKEYEALIEELEDQEDVRLFDEALKDDDGERISFEEYVKNREKKQ
ncbi:MAG: hypothetical protein ABIQ02_01055 [Saprospiraceae bacterium]